jgi:signal transduction histidine kinase
MKRLYTKIYMHFLLLLFVVGVATTAVFSIGQRGAFWREVTERMSRHFSNVLGERFADSAARQAAVRQLHEDFDIELTVRDLDGNLLAVGGTALPPLSPRELGVLRGGRDLFRQRPYSVTVPIRDNRTRAMVGLIDIAPPHRLRSMATPGLGRPVAAVALVLLLVGVLTAPLARRISHPVERLTEATRRFGAGELGYRIPVEAYCEPDPHFHHHHHRHFHFFHHHPRHRRHDQMNELVRAWNDMAERIERLVRGQKELLANISHELRSPLARVRLALELLPREPDSESRLRDVEADLAELERLIADVLMTSRLGATGLPTKPLPVELSPLLHQVAERAGHDPLTAGKQVVVKASPGLVIEADAALVRRAVFNLVENAAKYGAAPITISTAPAPEGDAVLIAVSDEGEGIAAADRERVFEPFFRADKARSHSGTAPHGFGLGLTLARRVAEAHGGTITISALHVRDGRESGCRVTLRLPLQASRKGAWQAQSSMQAV